MLGLSVGSFLNCYIWRLHIGKKNTGRSMCPKCSHQISWYDNIPVLSFILLKAKCRKCKKSISWQYLVVELVTAMLFYISFYLTSRGLAMDQLGGLEFVLISLRNFFIISVLIVIFIYDLKWYLILDKVTFPAMAVVFGLNLLTGVSWSGMLISGIIGGSFFLVQFLVSKGKWIGGGDIRLGFLMGLMLSWPNILVALFLSYITGSVIGVFLIIFGKKKMDSQVPFGVFLTASTLITMFYGSELLAWYLELM